jgi:hypothetical protein
MRAGVSVTPPAAAGNHLDRTIRIGIGCLSICGADQGHENSCHRSRPNGDPSHALSLPPIFLLTQSLTTSGEGHQPLTAERPLPVGQITKFRQAPSEKIF